MKESIKIKEIKEIYLILKDKINKRLNEFRRIWEDADEEIVFAELIFCLLTPQSKAKLCWKAVENLKRKNLLMNGNLIEIVNELNKIRFKNRKALYIIQARNQFSTNGKISTKELLRKLSDPQRAREWLVKNVKGIGYKEASHFLRNVGLSENLAILDRHILKNLKSLGVINNIPKSLSKKQYIEIERKMIELSREISIPLNSLDLIFWYKETGEIFK